jgi:hypothetical protein
MAAECKQSYLTFYTKTMSTNGFLSALIESYATNQTFMIKYVNQKAEIELTFPVISFNYVQSDSKSKHCLPRKWLKTFHFIEKHT